MRSSGIMKALVVALLAGCSCLGQPMRQTPVIIGGQPWTAYAFHPSDPAVVRISAPDLNLALPPYPTVSVRSSSSGVLASGVPVVAPVISSVPAPVVPAPVAAHLPVLKAAHLPVLKAAHLPVLKAAPAPVITSAAPAPIPVVKAGPAAVPAPVVPVASPVAVAVAPEPLQAPEPPMPSIGEPFVGGQFHAQDEAGQYSFGHWGGPNTRVETRDSLGRTTGSFAYVDPEGDVQVRKYAAAPASGFKVAASDLPVDRNLVVQDTPEVAQVKAAHARAVAAVRSIQSSLTVV